MRKGAGIIIAAACMLQGTPFAASAADTANETITVQVTIQTDTTVLDKAEVSAGDENGDGQLTVEDVLIAAHDRYYEGGAKAGYVRSCEDAPALSEVWGIRGDYISYILDADGAEKTGAPEDGDCISVLLQYAAPDTYRFRHGTLNQIPVGEHVNLKLLRRRGRNGSEEPVSDAVILIDGKRTAIRTDERGFAAVSFRDPGVHTVSAKLNGTDLLDKNEQVTVVPRKKNAAAELTEKLTEPAAGLLAELTGSETEESTEPAVTTVTSVLETTVSAALTKLRTDSVQAGESAPLAAFCGAGAVAIAAALICGRKKNNGE